jgi:hypothetical protein
MRINRGVAQKLTLLLPAIQQAGVAQKLEAIHN